MNALQLILFTNFEDIYSVYKCFLKLNLEDS